MKRSVLMLTLVAMSAPCGGKLLQADIIRFEDIATPGSYNTQASTFISGNFMFTQAGTGNSRHAVVRNDQPYIPNTGSNTYVGDGGGPASIIMTERNGAAFDLNSLLAAEGRNTNTRYFDYSARSIDVLGTFAVGGTISTNLNLDLYAQEDASNDFELFTLNGFDNLLSVQFTGVGGPNDGYSFALDDINVVARTAAVPEPGAGVFAMALIGMGFWRRRQRRIRMKPESGFTTC